MGSTPRAAYAAYPVAQRGSAAHEVGGRLQQRGHVPGGARLAHDQPALRKQRSQLPAGEAGHQHGARGRGRVKGRGADVADVLAHVAPVEGRVRRLRHQHGALPAPQALLVHPLLVAAAAARRGERRPLLAFGFGLGFGLWFGLWFGLGFGLWFWTFGWTFGLDSGMDLGLEFGLDLDSVYRYTWS